jgi:hypothetical protein
MQDAQRPTTTPESRDRALRLLRRLTWWVGGSAALAVAVLATVAAKTIPGNNTGASTQADSTQVSSGASTSSSQDNAVSSGLQQATSQVQSAASRRAHATSGGS